MQTVYYRSAMAVWGRIRGNTLIIQLTPFIVIKRALDYLRSISTLENHAGTLCEILTNSPFLQIANRLNISVLS